jgi:TrmH family RNA methyltransferase
VVDAVRLRRARARKDAGQTLVEGPHLLADLIRFGVPIDRVFALPDDANSAALAVTAQTELVVVDESVLRKVADTDNPRGPVAVIPTPESVTHRGSVVVLWDISDPGNAGTVVRSAAAFGFGVVMAANSVDVWSPKTIRAGGGGHFATKIEVAPRLTLIELRERGLQTIATVGTGGVGPSEIPGGPVAILVGNEAHGLPDEVATAADWRFTIPMPGGTESLNAAAAASIALYAIGSRSAEGGG